MNKNGAPMQWQVTPYFIHFAQTLSVKAKFRNRLKRFGCQKTHFEYLILFVP